MANNKPQRDAVVADRGGIIENIHFVHAAVVDSSGRLLFALGESSRVALSRSAAKPAQAVAILETGAFELFAFDQADLALMCASHSSEDRHVSRARAMLGKVQAGEDLLRCGGHPAISDVVNRRWIKQEFEPTPVCNNCSGKHAGMLGGARALGAEMSTYHLPENPMQQRVRRVVEELCGLREEEVQWAIDGCNLPAPAAVLHSFARMFASFSNAADKFELDVSATTSREQFQSRVFQAMTQYPEMVGGESRFCTVLMRAFKGEVFGKAGADGFYGVGVRASTQTRQLGAEGSLGIAVKVEDGNLDILYAVVAEILRQLNISNPEIHQELALFHGTPRFNTSGVAVGQLSFEFDLSSKHDSGYSTRVS